MLLTCNILLLWDHLEARVLLIPKFFLKTRPAESPIFAKVAIYRLARKNRFNHMSL